MKKSTIIMALLCLTFLSCNSVRITSAWKLENSDFKKYKKILVLGLIHETDRSIQQNMETHLVDELKELGYQAISSLSEYGPKAFDKQTEEAALIKLKNSGVDAVITIVLLDKKKEKKYIPSTIYYTPFGYPYSNFWGYRSILYERIYEPGYYVTESKFFWESNFFDMEKQKLVYSVQTQSFDKKDTEVLGHEYGKTIVKKMLQQNVLSAL